MGSLLWLGEADEENPYHGNSVELLWFDDLFADTGIRIYELVIMQPNDPVAYDRFMVGRRPDIDAPLHIAYAVDNCHGNHGKIIFALTRTNEEIYYNRNYPPAPMLSSLHQFILFLWQQVGSTVPPDDLTIDDRIHGQVGMLGSDLLDQIRARNKLLLSLGPIPNAVIDATLHIVGRHMPPLHVPRIGR